MGDIDQYENMANFVDVVSKVGVKRFSVHARPASGGSPKKIEMYPHCDTRYGQQSFRTWILNQWGY